MNLRGIEKDEEKEPKLEYIRKGLVSSSFIVQKSF